MNVYFTTDLEVWTDEWDDLDRQFPDAFRRYVYGRTTTGDFGLTRIVQMLAERALQGTFFTETLFAARFGLAPLTEIVGLLHAGRQDVQLHLHPEWADECRPPLVANQPVKRQFLKDFSLADQTRLVALGIDLLVRAGAARPSAFRAGSFGFDRGSLTALRENGIRTDSSYNACQFGPESGVASGRHLTETIECDGVVECPMTVFRDGLGRMRPAQVGACSFEELREAIEAAAEEGLQNFVILFHNFELLDRSKSRPDKVVVRRFERLCDYLAANRSYLVPASFGAQPPQPDGAERLAIGTSIGSTMRRYGEQLQRRVHGL